MEKAGSVLIVNELFSSRTVMRANACHSLKLQEETDTEGDKSFTSNPGGRGDGKSGAVASS